MNSLMKATTVREKIHTFLYCVVNIQNISMYVSLLSVCPTFHNNEHWTI